MIDITENRIPESLSSGIDIDSLRLPTNYASAVQVETLLVTVRVGKPPKTTFFRTHTDQNMVFPCYLYEQKEPQQESYIVLPSVVPILREHIKPTCLYTCIDRNNVVFLMPVTLPDENGERHSAHEERQFAAEHAKEHWTRISWNKNQQRYQVEKARGSLADPIWPNVSIDELIEIAFRNKIIKGADHPVVQTLQGLI